MLRSPLIVFDDTEEDFRKAVEIIVQYDRANASLLQRRLSIGYARAARLLDQLEAAGVVGPAEGTKPREVLISSIEEFQKAGGKWVKPEEDDPFVLPKNYQPPTNLKLSKDDKPKWGKQLADVISSKEYKNRDVQYPITLGYNDSDELEITSLLDINNLIVAGNPLSDKENWIDTVIVPLLLKHHPNDLRLVLIDQAHYLDFYNGVPHLLAPVITDYSKAVSAFRWALGEADRRLKLFTQSEVRNLKAYNKLAGSQALPITLIISFLSFADVEVADSLIALTTDGGRTGIHNLIVVGQTGDQSPAKSIKANVPSRVVFRLTQSSDSRAISVSGAETLEIGELIYKPNIGSQEKLKAVYTPEVNVKEVVEAVKNSS